jgi:hypothetical protein
MIVGGHVAASVTVKNGPGNLELMEQLSIDVAL